MKVKPATFNKKPIHKEGVKNDTFKNSKLKHQQKGKHRYFDLNQSPGENAGREKPTTAMGKGVPKNKKIVFDENSEEADVIEENVDKKLSKATTAKAEANSYRLKKAAASDDENQAWYLMYSEYNTNSDIVELKDTEIKALTETCQSNFESQHHFFLKKNPSDAKWLQTALHKGTAKDRVNSGALLVHSNPLANLEALRTLVGLIKVSNRVGSEVLTVISELFMEALIPADRKLMQLELRGADWKTLRNRDDVSSEIKNKIYAYWYFEAELKEQYFEFLKNLQQCLHIGKDPVKSAAVVCGAKLLCHGPEKEQLLLSMLINKLGDPSNKIAAKALHHLSEVTFKHPNMCGVITNETEKLLFRNNISEQAQHFALCFLAQVAPRGHSDVCTKLVNICFAFFKVLVKKGAVNNRTMQAILRCLQKAIVDAEPLAGTTEIMNKEMQDTVYRLVHMAEIQISLQTLSLLLQLITVKGEKPDRFYNALYRKMLDMNLTTIGTKVASQFFHIVHRAIHIDSNVSRCLAFIKRLLQISLYMPAHLTCGSLIVIHKVLKSRPELRKLEPLVDLQLTPSVRGEENVEEEETTLNTENNDLNTKESIDDKEEKGTLDSNYDPYHRGAAFSGAQFMERNELILLQKHFHPTCKVFTESIIAGKGNSYYGDPLRDFSLSHFLERFAFKNPKKVDTGNKDLQNNNSTVKSIYDKSYTPQGGRSNPVQSLTKDNCTEEERFIFNYLEKKREKQIAKTKEDDDVDDAESVDDDEFDAYLDGLCKSDAISDDDDEGLDFLKELGADLKLDDKIGGLKKTSKAKQDDDDSDMDKNDWSDEEGDNDESTDDESGPSKNLMASDSDDDGGSISLDENESLVSDDEDESSLANNSGSDSANELSLDESDEQEDSVSEEEDDEDGEDEYEPQKKKSKHKMLNSGKKFQKSLKHADDMSSLFAAADDFANLLESTSTDKRHGSSSAIFNTDKSSEKQLKWEEKRRNAGAKHHFGNKKPNKFGKNRRK